MLFIFERFKFIFYICKDLEELRKCSRCNSTMQLKDFSINRKGDLYKCCKNFNKKRNDWNQKPEVKGYSKQYYEEHKEHKKQMSKLWKQNTKDILNEKVVCEKCGAVTNRCNTPRHKQTIKCKETSKTKINNKPLSFVDYYVKLPIMKITGKKDHDMIIDSIVV